MSRTTRPSRWTGKMSSATPSPTLRDTWSGIQTGYLAPRTASLQRVEPVHAQGVVLAGCLAREATPETAPVPLRREAGSRRPLSVDSERQASPAEVTKAIAGFVGPDARVRGRALVRPERLRLSKAEATSAPTSACSPASRATPASARRRRLTDPSLVGSSRSSPRQTVPLSSGSKCGAREVRDERDRSGAAQSGNTVASIWNRNSG